MPPLARAMLGRGLTRKLAKTAFQLFHQRLGLSAYGSLVIDPDGTRLPFTANFANTAYLDFAKRAEGYEPEVTALLQRLAARVKSVYDIGANWGYYSALLAAHPAFTGKIEAFEISPRTARDLAHLLAQTRLDRIVRLHANGLSDQAGMVAIAEGMHSFLTHVAADGRGTQAPVDTLDAMDLPDPDLIKMDVEGHEAPVLRGGATRLARAKPLIVFENWRDQPEPLQILDGLGYRFLRLDWTPSGPHAGRLDLTPLPCEARTQIPGALNLLAVHPENSGPLDQLFGSAFP